MRQPQYRPVADLAELKQLARAQRITADIALAGGLAYSRKTIRLRGRKWFITNHIDDTRQVLTDEELWTASNVGRALDSQALIIRKTP